MTRVHLSIFSSHPLLRWAGIIALLCTTAPNFAAAMTMTPIGALSPQFILFPADNWWNVDVSAWPVDPASSRYVTFINNGTTRRLHPDLGGKAGTSTDPFASYGMPYMVISGATSSDLVAVQFQYSSESDGVNHKTDQSFPFYPIPAQAATQPYLVEGGDPGNIDLRDSQDRHLLIVDSDRNFLYELYNVFYDSTQAQWFAGSGAFFDLRTNQRRPDSWTSADAAGLAIFPSLLRYEEVFGSDRTEINHAFRVTVRATDGYVYPASHQAGSHVGALPMGARLRLKANIDVTQRTKDPNMQRIFRAFQRHGLIVADNGSDMFITGTYDLRWDSDVLNPAFRSLTADDFEVLQLGYNPPLVSTPALPVPNLRASLQGRVLRVTWDKPSMNTTVQIQVSDRIQADAPWEIVTQSSDTSWSQPLDPSSPGRFYRVIVLPE